jgi:DNA polymerase-3 subunit gamma/tau
VVRFGVVLSVVLVAIGLLVTGVVAGSLRLVAISIGVAVLAFLLLIGVVISFRQEIFGRPAPKAALPSSAVAKSAVPEQEAARAVGVSETGGPGARAKAGDGKRAETGRDTGSQPDGRQRATGVRTKVPVAEPVAQPSKRAASTATSGTGPDKSAGQAAAAGAASTVRPDRTGQDRPEAEPAAASKDRSDSAPAQHQDRAENHRASRLERESARAAGARAASSAAAPTAGDRPAAATASSPPEAGTPAGAMAPAARDNDQRQQEQHAVGAVGGEAQPESATRSAGGARSDQKPGRPAEPKPAAAASTAGSAAVPPAADLSGPSAAASPPEPRPQAPAAELPASADSAQVSVVPGITRYHRGDCLLIRFLSADDLEVMTRQAATESGCMPCKACKPDQETADLPVS